jgi:hypothetical protein
MIPEIIGIIILFGGGSVAFFRNKKNEESIEFKEEINKKCINPQIYSEFNYFICLKCKEKIDSQDVIFWYKWPFCSDFCIELYKAEKNFKKN